MPIEVHEKWGFGMAPPLPKTATERRQAAAAMLTILTSVDLPPAEPAILDAFSCIKGMFTRAFKEDQWDWFTVLSQLGYPSARVCKAMAASIADCRSAIRDADERSYWTARSDLMRLPLRCCLATFLGTLVLTKEAGAGWIYALSTRELPDLLKIGMTTRSVQERVREINASTGVAIPFGVRRCWFVSDPARVEREAHAALSDHRVRGDREFFRIDFFDAARSIAGVLQATGLALRTLDNLGALGGDTAMSAPVAHPADEPP